MSNGKHPNMRISETPAPAQVAVRSPILERAFVHDYQIMDNVIPETSQPEPSQGMEGVQNGQQPPEPQSEQALISPPPADMEHQSATGLHESATKRYNLNSISDVELTQSDSGAPRGAPIHQNSMTPSRSVRRDSAFSRLDLTPQSQKREQDKDRLDKAGRLAQRRSSEKSQQSFGERKALEQPSSKAAATTQGSPVGNTSNANHIDKLPPTKELARRTLSKSDGADIQPSKNGTAKQMAISISEQSSSTPQSGSRGPQEALAGNSVDKSKLSGVKNGLRNGHDIRGKQNFIAVMRDHMSDEESQKPTSQHNNKAKPATAMPSVTGHDQAPLAGSDEIDDATARALQDLTSTPCRKQTATSKTTNRKAGKKATLKERPQVTPATKGVSLEDQMPLPVLPRHDSDENIVEANTTKGATTNKKSKVNNRRTGDHAEHSMGKNDAALKQKRVPVTTSEILPPPRKQMSSSILPPTVALDTPTEAPPPVVQKAVSPVTKSPSNVDSTAQNTGKKPTKRQQVKKAAPIAAQPGQNQSPSIQKQQTPRSILVEDDAVPSGTSIEFPPFLLIKTSTE